MGGGGTIGVRETMGKLEVQAVDKSTIVVETQDLEKLADWSILINPDGTHELIDWYTEKYRVEMAAMSTLKRVQNSQPPQITKTFYQMVSRDSQIVFVEDYSSIHTQGHSDSYDIFNEKLSEAGE